MSASRSRCRDTRVQLQQILGPLGIAADLLLDHLLADVAARASTSSSSSRTWRARAASAFTSASRLCLTIYCGLRRHAAKIDRQIDPFGTGEIQHALGDVLGQIAHPLQIVVDLQHRHDEPQIGGHRLIEGQDLQALLPRPRPPCGRSRRRWSITVRARSRVAIDQGRDGVGDGLFDQRADVAGSFASVRRSGDACVGHVGRGIVNQWRVQHGAVADAIREHQGAYRPQVSARQHADRFSRSGR